MRACTILPCPRLEPYILYYSVLQTAQLEPVTLVGLSSDSVQLSLNFGADVRVERNGKAASSTSLMLLGPTPHSDLVTLTSHIDAVMVVFRTGAAGAFLGIPTAELNGQLTDAEVVWPEALKQACFDLEGLSPRCRIERLEQLLLANLDERFLLPPSVVRALELTERARGQVRIRQLAYDIGVSERTLQRQLTDLIGLTPKQLSRTLRIRHAAKLLHRTPRANWAELALSCGFYDQAHLTNEMVELTGHTPSEFARLDDSQGFYLKPAEH